MIDKSSESKQKKEKIAKNFIFSDENVNMGRQPEVDYLKAFLCFFMVYDHVYYHYSIDNYYFYIITEFITFIFGAGGFMFLMGMGMKYTRHHEPKNYFIRGIGLLTISQLVNLLRDALPNIIVWWTTGSKTAISNSMLVLQADILSFSGIAFLFLALMKKMKLSDVCIFTISIIMNLGTFFLFKIINSPKNFLLSQFLGYFILTNAEAYFPLGSYFIFVAFGYWLGGIYQKILNKNKFYNLIIIFCLPIVTIYFFLRTYYNFPILPEIFSDEYYSLYPGPDGIICCMANLTALAILYKIDVILKRKTPEFIVHSGKNLNEYYIISSLFIIPMNTFLVAAKGEEFPSNMKFPSLFAFMILVVCRIVIEMNDKYIHFAITSLKNPKRNLIFIFIWIMTIISVIYIYPKVEVYATIWNNYLKQNKNEFHIFWNN